MSNPNPDTSGFHASGRSAVFWEEQQVDHCIRCWIKGERYTPLPPAEHPVLIKKREVLRRTGLSYVTIWKKERDGKFPQRVQLEAADAAAD
jgi:hypothetical protein